ncbi:UNVERIFIED_CONTAM: hypothetical protein H355_013025, partial [Colinus virginianus]
VSTAAAPLSVHLAAAVLVLLLQVRELAKAFCRTQVVKLQIGDAELQASSSIAQRRCVRVSNLLQRVEVVSSGQLQQRLLEVLQETGGEKVLVFCETKRQCDQLCRELRYRQMRALALHGDKEQRERDRSVTVIAAAPRCQREEGDACVRALHFLAIGFTSHATHAFFYPSITIVTVETRRLCA